jgi:hypothetical protein
MGLRHCMGYLLREHEELLSLASKIESLLESASENNFSEHVKTIADLRALEHGLAGIVEHCHAADRLVESAYYKDFQQTDLARISADHLHILQAVASFKEELKCATPDRTMAMILPGMDVVKLLREHVAFEGALFSRLAARAESHEKKPVGKSGTKRAAEKHRPRAARRSMPKEPPPDVPYTLEPHPEL